MTTKLNLIIALIVLIIIIIYKIKILTTKKTLIKSHLYYHSKKLIKYLYIISIIIFITSLIINITLIKDNIIMALINSLSVSLLTLPLSLNGLYERTFNDEENYSHIKTIITKEQNPEYLKKFNRAGINIIILSPSTNILKLPVISEKEINKKNSQKNIIIKTNKETINSPYIKENAYQSQEALSKIYNKIMSSRIRHDDYIRTIKYLILTYLPLVISYYFLRILGYPMTYNILLVVILKLFTVIMTYLYQKLPPDQDISYRKVKKSSIFIGKQETSLTILESIYIFFIINVPYMFVISQGGTESFANTLFLVIFTYTNYFLTYTLLNDSLFLKNIIKSYKNIFLIIYTLITIIISIIFNFTTYFNTKNIGLHNYISCIAFSIIAILFNELIKLARFTSTKGSKKNAKKSKNNQKH